MNSIHRQIRHCWGHSNDFSGISSITSRKSSTDALQSLRELMGDDWIVDLFYWIAVHIDALGNSHCLSVASISVCVSVLVYDQISSSSRFSADWRIMVLFFHLLELAKKICVTFVTAWIVSHFNCNQMIYLSLIILQLMHMYKIGQKHWHIMVLLFYRLV